MAIALNCIAKKITNIVLVLALKLEMELIRGLYDRERTLNSYKDEDAEDMKSVDISQGCKCRYLIRLWIIYGVTLHAGM